jgi:magnesium chelatase family protein
LPAQFLLLGATNPCPCGGGAPGACECDEAARARYLRRLSGPLLDRFDLRVPVSRPLVDDLLVGVDGEPSAVVAQRVVRARDLATRRNSCLNSGIRASLLDSLAPLHPAAQKVLRIELERNRLTGRGYHRVRRVARTLADLDPIGDEIVSEEHVVTALQFRVRLSPMSSGRAA